MFGYREPFHISSPGKQDLEYKIITFKIFRVRKTKSSVYKQNLFKFPLPETAVPHPPGVRAPVATPAIHERIALSDLLLTVG